MDRGGVRNRETPQRLWLLVLSIPGAALEPWPACECEPGTPPSPAMPCSSGSSLAQPEPKFDSNPMTNDKRLGKKSIMPKQSESETSQKTTITRN